MVPRPLATACCALVAALIGGSTAVAAQTVEQAPAVDPAAEVAPTEPTEPVAAEPAAADSADPAPTEPVEPTEPAAVDPADPMSQEGPGEAAPDTEVTIPPPDADGTEDLREPARILWSSVGAAERKLAEATEEREDTIASIRVLRKRRKELTVESQQLGAESAQTVAELAAATDRFRSRAVLGFQEFGSGSEEEATTDFSDYRQIIDGQRRSRMVDAALKFDEADLERLAELQARLSSDGRAVLDRIRVVSDHLFEVELRVAELEKIIEEATVEYEAFKAGSQVFIHGAVFPIAPGYDTALIDSWGFPRMVGTEDEHGHEGIDIFAPRGTPLVAAERGVIDRVGIGRLGGLKFWLRGESGSDWYYAHLDSFAPDLENGLVVDAGDLLGYVGDTGNAVGTPPHLHLQLHPGGGDPVNPYPLLKVVSDIEQAALAAGTFAGYDYEVVVSDRRPEPPAEPETPVDEQPTETEDSEPSVPTSVEGPNPVAVEESTTTVPAEAPPASTEDPATGDPAAADPAADGEGPVEPAPVTDPVEPPSGGEAPPPEEPAGEPEPSP